MPNPKFEIAILDVGQGLAIIVHLGKGKAIVIDGGPAGRNFPTKTPIIPLKFLRQYVTEVLLLVISHNDSDHSIGALRILQAMKGAVRRIGFVMDGPLKRLEIFEELMSQIKDGVLTSESIIRLEADATRRRIFSDKSIPITIDALSPLPIENLDAIKRETPNATSAILEIKCENIHAVVPGDAVLTQFESVFSRFGRLECEVLVVPHHGGRISKSANDTDAHRADLDWLYNEAIKTNYAIVSVGTSNRYGHPNEEHVDALRRAGVKILCTQMTRACIDDLEHGRSIMRYNEPFGVSSTTRDETSGGNPRNVACAGSVFIDVGSDGVAIRREKDHKEKVRLIRVHVSGHPLCD